MAAAPHVFDPELVSPELALVDPELAAQLRSVVLVTEELAGRTDVREERVTAAGAAVGVVSTNTATPDPRADLIVVPDLAQPVPDILGLGAHDAPAGRALVSDAQDERSPDDSERRPVGEPWTPAEVGDDVRDPLADILVSPTAATEPTPSPRVSDDHPVLPAADESAGDDVWDPLADILVSPTAATEPTPSPRVSDYPALPAADDSAGDDAHAALERIRAQLAVEREPLRSRKRVRRGFTFTLGATVLGGLVAVVLAAGLPHAAF